MASTGTSTPNIGLNQWLGTDAPERADFNRDNLAVDFEMGKIAQEAAAGTVTVNGQVKAVPERISAPVHTVTGSITLALNHAGCLVDCNNTANITVTVPAGITAAFADGTELEILRRSTGTVTLAGAGGVTLLSKGNARSIADQYTGAALKKLSGDTWLLLGNLG